MANDLTSRLSEPALKRLRIEKRRTRGLRWSRLVRGSELSLQSEPLRLGRNTALDATSDFGRSAGKRKEPTQVPRASNCRHCDSHIPRTSQLRHGAPEALNLNRDATAPLPGAALFGNVVHFLPPIFYLTAFLLPTAL